MENIVKKITFFKFNENKDVEVEFKGKVTYICGSNGSGKSKLLNSIENSINGDYFSMNCQSNACNKGAITKKLFHEMIADTRQAYLKEIIQEHVSLHSSSLNNYSSGEKKLISLLMGVYLNNNSKLFLIDDIETGLHINTQKRIVSTLLEIAPEAQFIITTHSPCIVKNVWNSLINLDDFNKTGE